MTLDLLLFAITFTICLEIEFDFSFYVRLRSEEISPEPFYVSPGKILQKGVPIAEQHQLASEYPIIRQDLTN